MAKTERVNSPRNDLEISPRDILFECPACGKSLVVDEAAAGLIINCPQCHIAVIVPPKPAPPTVQPPAAPPAVSPAPANDLSTRLQALSNQLRELQTQRAEINNRLAARINELNRDLVMTARLETSHQQILSELNQLIGQLTSGDASSQSPATGAGGRTRVNLRS